MIQQERVASAMLPTFIGLILFIVGFVILTTRKMQAMLVFTQICTLMGGSAAFILPALGGSSIPPSMLAMGLLMLRGFQNEPGRRSEIPNALRACRFFIVFGLYAVASAMLLPRIFANKISVVPLKPLGLRNLFDVFPLEPSSQNITAAFYIVGSVLLCVFSYVAVTRRMGAVYFVRGAIVIVCLHALFGIMNVALPTSVWTPISAVFRNGSYASVDQTIGQVIRIGGIMSEPSAYAGYGFGWLIFITELWLRDIMPRATGPTALVMGIVLAASTSSSAYVCLGAYLVILLLRMVLFPRFFRFDKIFALGVFALVLAVAASLLLFLKPIIIDTMLKILQDMTVNKGQSESGQQRAFWAKQGLYAFNVSYGLGIGAGSFRSSSSVTAIIGSMGVLGAVTYVLHLGSVFQPWRRSTFEQSENQVEAVGIAAAWAAFFIFIAGSLGAPSPDPGPNFSILTGVALALRRRSSPSAIRAHDVSHLPSPSFEGSRASATSASAI